MWKQKFTGAKRWDMSEENSKVGEHGKTLSEGSGGSLAFHHEEAIVNPM